jgi:hypothetical protein
MRKQQRAIAKNPGDACGGYKGFRRALNAERGARLKGQHLLD